MVNIKESVHNIISTPKYGITSGNVSLQVGQIIDIRAMINDATRLSSEDGVDSAVSTGLESRLN